jgi:uncharacterized protein YcbK (DUF882 family)
VTVDVARRIASLSRSARAASCCSIAALIIFFGCKGLQTASADAETRTISFHHMHTDETLTVTYKVNGRYDEQALARIDQVLRDWRENQAIRMDPHLIDLLWEVHRETGSKEPIWVVCGYRSPATNSMLRRRSSGVAQFSQHMLGKAIDFYIPGVPLDQLRAAGLRAERGGVGFYPTSGAPFVHLDTGSVRHWPRMPEAQMASVLSKGPLGGRGASDAKGVVVAQADSQGSGPAGFFARLFGGGSEDRASDSRSAAQTTLAKGNAPTRKITARLIPETRPEKTAAATDPRSEKSAAAVNPKLASASSSEVQAQSKPIRVAQAASLAVRADVSANDIINERGYWQGLPNTEAADAPQAGQARPAANPRRTPGVALASAEPVTTVAVSPWASIDRSANEVMPSALAYASEATPIAARATPIAAGVPRALAAATPAEAVVALKRGDDQPAAVPARTGHTSVVRVGDRFNDPWMRAMIVSPSAHTFMRTTLYGVPDFRNLRPHLHKPVATVTMTFSDDPHLGITTEKFAGSAVVFIPTMTFSARTAALR